MAAFRGAGGKAAGGDARLTSLFSCTNRACFVKLAAVQHGGRGKRRGNGAGEIGRSFTANQQSHFERCRTAKTAERSAADAKRCRSSAKSRFRPAGARASGHAARSTRPTLRDLLP